MCISCKTLFSVSCHEVLIVHSENYHEGDVDSVLHAVKLFVVAGTTKGYQKPLSESDGNVTDAAAEPAPVGDHTDAIVHESPSVDSLQTLIHEKADVLIARSTVSGIHLI